MRRLGIFCAVACGLLLIGIGATPSYFREISVGGGYGSAAQGDDPAGGIWLEDGGNLLMDGDLTVDGDGTVGGTLGVTGNTTVGGTLGVTGNTTVGGTLGVTGNTTVGGTLGVTGNTTLGGTAAVTGNTSTLGTMGVGTATPDAATRLHVYQNTAASVRIRVENNEGSVDFGANDATCPIWIDNVQYYAFGKTLFGSQDIQVNGGDIFGPGSDGTLNVSSEGNVIVMLDSNSNSPAASDLFLIRCNGNTVNRFAVDGSGTMTSAGGTIYSTIGTFAADDTTPSVAGARFFKPAATGHSGAVAVTALDDGVAGQEIIILGVATNETWTLTDDSTLANMDGNWVAGAATNIHLVFDGTNWFEIARR